MTDRNQQGPNSAHADDFYSPFSDKEVVQDVNRSEPQQGGDQSILSSKAALRQSMMAEYAPELHHVAEKDQGVYPEAILPSNTDKIVSHGRPGDCPQVIDNLSPLYTRDAEIQSPVSPNTETATLTAVPSDADRQSQADESLSEKPTSKRIWGLRPVTFWLLVALAIVIIGAAVAGGVAGSIISRNNQKDVDLASSTKSNETAQSSTTPTQNSNPTKTQESGQSVVSTQVADYQATLQYYAHLYEETNYGGRWLKIQAVGLYKSEFPIVSYRWRPGNWNPYQMCSLTFCIPGELGENHYRGGDPFDRPKIEGETMPKVFMIRCGGQFQGGICPDDLDDNTAFVTPPVLQPLATTKAAQKTSSNTAKATPAPTSTAN